MAVQMCFHSHIYNVNVVTHVLRFLIGKMVKYELTNGNYVLLKCKTYPNIN